jgi:dihydroorotate dehydrogenase
MSNIINKYTHILKYIVCSNSVPNCIAFNKDGPVLHNILGGLSGKLNKYISLSNVFQFSKLINKSIKIVGCGGIDTIEDVMDYLNNGADFVQIASCFLQNNELDIIKINNLVVQLEQHVNKNTK